MDIDNSSFTSFRPQPVLAWRPSLNNSSILSISALFMIVGFLHQACQYQNSGLTFLTGINLQLEST